MAGASGMGRPEKAGKGARSHSDPEASEQTLQLRCAALERENAELRSALRAAAAEVERARPSGTGRSLQPPMSEASRGLEHRVGVWRWELFTDRVTWSDDLFRLLGYEPGEFEPTLERFFELVHPEDLERVRERSRAVSRGEQVAVNRARLRAKDGSYRQLLMTGNPAHDQSGRLAGLVGTLTDVTDLEALERHLSTLSAAFEHVQRLGRVGAFWQDLESGQMNWSTGLEQLVGHPQGQRPDVDALLDCIHTDDRSKFLAMKRRCDRDRKVEPRDMRLCLADGSERRVSVEMEILPETDVRPSLWVGVLVDVTVRDTLQRELRVVKQREVVGRLASGVVHDFSNLVQVVELEARALQQSLDEEDPRTEHVQAILDVNQRATIVIRRLLGMTRRASSSAVSMNLNSALRRLEELLCLAAGPRIKVRLELDDTRHQVVCDPTDLEQAVLNLVVNARDASPTGGEVLIRTRFVDKDAEGKSAPALVVSVSDQGTGMNDEVRALALDPFFTTKGERGTGLGLSTVREVVETYGGSLSLWSREGEGTTVSLKFPVLQRGVDSSTDLAPMDHPSLRRGCVLVVDDEPAVYAGVEDALWRRGLRCVVADSGERALELLRERGDEIVVVLTDLAMEPMSGIELGRRIREGWPDKPLLYMTGLLESPWVEKIDAPLLRKPFSPDELVGTIGKAAAGARGPAGAPRREHPPS